jgi:hypothetical protein
MHVTAVETVRRLDPTVTRQIGALQDAFLSACS